jgi:hypothetical protein
MSRVLVLLGKTLTTTKIVRSFIWVDLSSGVLRSLKIIFYEQIKTNQQKHIFEQMFENEEQKSTTLFS